jgi:hypothetical protein
MTVADALPALRILKRLKTAQKTSRIGNFCDQLVQASITSGAVQQCIELLIAYIALQL